MLACLRMENTRTRKTMMAEVVTISHVSRWSSARWVCRFDGLGGHRIIIH
jgi:hypothetical protein